MANPMFVGCISKHLQDSSRKIVNKKNVRRQCRGSLRIDELFLDNQSLADDRSVAHYNLEDGCILETTSNPLWVSCLYIKASEIKQEMEGNPNDSDIQKWTQKSLPKKYTLIGLLLNAKNEYGKQPPHFATLDEFALYLERLKKKGATMHPEYTQKDMRAFEREYRQEFVGKYDDPIAAFIDHHAVRLGLALPDEIEQRPVSVRQKVKEKVIYQRVNNNTAKPRGCGRKKQEKFCDDCEEALAEVYCGECQGGLAMCRACSNVLHAGASRRRHNLQDIDQAPTNNSKPYIPRAFLAPFSIVLAMFSALSRDSKLSLTEDEIKRRAQPLTDTDLQDKQAGKYVGGFDCMENVLMNKGLVKKEAARIPTYALSVSGQVLGQKLYTFYNQFYTFMESCRLPKIQNKDSAIFRTGVVNNRKLYLIIDENERDKQRLLRYANEKNIDAQVRLLPAGDYIWVLTPPMVDTSASYTGRDYGNELVLPFVVERKSWEDFENSTNGTRFKRQINNMLGSGLTNCFYLMEGSTSGLKNNSTHHHQQYLKGLLEKLMTENGFYINYTSSWMKSAQWLLWFTGLLSDGCKTGLFGEGCISYQEYMSRVGRQRGNSTVNTSFTGANRHTHTWKASLFVDHIIRDSQRERTMLTTVREDLLGVTNRSSKHLLVIQDLEQYNKKRQAALNKCCEAVYANPDRARDIVEEKLGPVVHNMLHYDIASYWQLYIQVMTGVYVVRTEALQDTEKICRIFTSAPRLTPFTTDNSLPVPKVGNRGSTIRKKPTWTVTDSTVGGEGHISDAPTDTGSIMRHLSASPLSAHRKIDKEKTVNSPRKANIRSVYSEVNNSTSPFHFVEDNVDVNATLAGHVIKKDNHWLNREQNMEVSSKNEAIQPFSGKGYCLGTCSVDNQEHSFVPGCSQPGLVGGMRKSQDNRKRLRENSISNEEVQMIVSDTDKLLHFNTDFVDSQNEEDVLKEILAKSAAEVSSISCEVSSVPGKRGNCEIESDVNLLEDEQLKHAIEISKFETGILEKKNEIPVSTEVEDVDDLAEELMMRHALEMSMVEDGNDLPGNSVKLLPTDNDNDDVILIQETQEDQEKTVNEKSRKEAHKKKGNESRKNGPINIDCWNSFSCKRKIDEFQKSDIDFSERLEEEDQLKLAFEMSLSHVTGKNNCSGNKTNTNEYGLSPCKKPRLGRDIFSTDKGSVLENNDTSFEKEKEDFKFMIESRKVDHGLDKIEKLKNLNEQELLNVGINRNMIEHSHSSDIEVIEIDSQNSQENETENTAVVLVSSCYSDYGLEKSPSSNKLMLEENGRNCLVSQSVSEDSEKACCKDTRDNNIEHLDRRSSDKNEFVTCSFSVESDLSQEISLDTIDTELILKDNGDAAGNDSVDIDSDYIPPSPERTSLSNSIVSQSFFSITSDTFGHRSQTVQSPIVKSFVKETSSEVPSKYEVLDDIDSSHRNCIDVNDKFTKDERNEDFEREIPEESGDEEEEFDIKTSLFYNSSDSEYENEGDLVDKSIDDDDDGDQNKERNHLLNENQKVHDVSESASTTTNCSHSESRHTFRESKEADYGIESGDINNDLLQLSKSENYSSNEFVENHIKLIVNSNSETDNKLDNNSNKTDKTKSHANDIRGLEDENENSINEDNKPLEDVYLDNDVADDQIDFQPDSQDIDIKSESDSEEDKSSDLEETSVERNDPDFLPVIGRPRGMRYRQLKEESEQMLIKLRKEKELEKQLNIGTVLKTDVSSDSDHEESDLTADEIYARQVQKDLDREAEQIEAQRALIDDAYIARQLHESLNKQNLPNYQGRELDNWQSFQNDQYNNLSIDSDRVKNTYIKPHREQESPRKFVRGYGDNVEMSRDVKFGNSEAVVRDLQRREFEKIDKWRKMLQIDEKLAKSLQVMNNDNTTDGSRTNQLQSISNLSQNVEPSFKKMIAQHKASREKAIVQLQEYRSVQMERFQKAHGGLHHCLSSTQTSHNNNSNKDDVIILDEPSDFPLPKTYGTPYRNTRPILNCHENRTKFGVKNHSNRYECQSSEQNQKTNNKLYDNHSNQPIHSQSLTGSQLFTSYQSKNCDADHLTQTPSVKHINVTCGNCGEKGHTRTFPRCPKYHTAEESSRREAKLEKQRQQKEEKQKQEVETIHMLSEHRRVLEEMTSQIQREMGTIQNRLQQRATELESQVNVRVRKIENANKRKRNNLFV